MKLVIVELLVGKGPVAGIRIVDLTNVVEADRLRAPWSGGSMTRGTSIITAGHRCKNDCEQSENEEYATA